MVFASPAISVCRFCHICRHHTPAEVDEGASAAFVVGHAGHSRAASCGCLTEGSASIGVYSPPRTVGENCLTVGPESMGA